MIAHTSVVANPSPGLHKPPGRLYLAVRDSRQVFLE
jgi:hypothetical protein